MVSAHVEGSGAGAVNESLLYTETPQDSLSGKVKPGGMLNVGAALRYDLGTLSGKAFEAGGHRPENGTGGGSQMGADPGSCRIQMQNTARGARRFLWY